MLSNYPDELTCDMAETYGVFDIYRLPVRTLATLAVGLRDDSRVMMAKRGAIVDNKTILIAQMVDLLGGINPKSEQSLTMRSASRKRMSRMWKAFSERPTPPGQLSYRIRVGLVVKVHLT